MYEEKSAEVRFQAGSYSFLLEKIKRPANKKQRIESKYGLLPKGSRYVITDRKVAQLLTHPKPPPVTLLGRRGRDELKVRALVWLGCNQLGVVQVQRFEQGCGDEADRVHLSLALLPAIFQATQDLPEAGSCMAVLMEGLQAECRARRRALRQATRLILDRAAPAAKSEPEVEAGPSLGQGPMRASPGLRPHTSSVVSGPSPEGKGSVSERAGGDKVEVSGEGGEEEEEEEGEGELPEPSALRDQLFSMVLPADWQQEEGEPAGLRCKLYRYQRRALSWMLWREGFSGRGAAAGRRGDPDSVKTHLPQNSLVWQRVDLEEGAVYWDPLQRRLSPRPLPPPLPPVPGGLLCDEMGLGKTVEVIAAVLANPRPPAAEAGASGVVDGGTLVVCPGTLLQQWRSELGNHAAGALHVEVYDGLDSMRPVCSDRKAYKKPAQRELELYERMLSGQELVPAFNLQAEAEGAALRLRGADVVLTTFDVLQREVYYSPNARSAGLRHAKRYVVPTCPLLQIGWWRLVVDEAQLVGPMSSCGAMVERMHAVHRWCVTGTPLTLSAAHALSDVRGLLHVLQHPTLAEHTAWGLLVGAPFREGDFRCWALLRALLRPLMWRNTKAEVAEEFRLPPRTLTTSYLHFQAGEKEVYDQILEGMRTTRDELLAEEESKQGEAASDGKGAGEAGQGGCPPSAASPGSSPAAGASGGGGLGPASTLPTAPSRRRRRRAREERLREEASSCLLQLRLACIHPQLTKHWQQLSSDLQLNMGGTLSMEEIMQRLVDKAQYELQEKERSLCAHLNTLAVLLLRGSEGGGLAGQRAPGERGEGHEAGSAEGGRGPSSLKRRKLSARAPGGDPRREALQLLERSYRVGEKGIDAWDTPMEDMHQLEDITAAGGTIVAWRRLQLHTEHQLSLLYQSLGRAGDAERMSKDMKEKMDNVREHAVAELTQAKSKLSVLQQQGEEVRAALLSGWERAHSLGFPTQSWGTTGSAERWLEMVGQRYSQAQQAEEAERQKQSGNTQHVLGEVVHKALGELEEQVQAELSVLERFVDNVHLAQAVEEVQSALAEIEGPSNQQQLEGVCQLLRRNVRLLTSFKRRTLQAQWFWILPPDSQAPDVEVRGIPVQECSQGVALQSAQPNAPWPLQQQQVALDQGMAAQVTVCPASPIGTSKLDGEESTELAAKRDAATEAALQGAKFIEAGSFLGALTGYAFKLGDHGMGYYPDSPPDTAPLLTADTVTQCTLLVLRALRDQLRKLEKLQSVEGGTLSQFKLDCVEARLASARHQVHLVRLLKDTHVAECSVFLKSSLQADVDADLELAAQEAPLSLTSHDVLQKRIHDLRQNALEVRNRKRFMMGKLQEAHQLASSSVADRKSPPSEPCEASDAPRMNKTSDYEAPSSNNCANSTSAQEEPRPCAMLGGQRLDCPVCLNEITEDIMVFGGCGHSFCNKCAPKLVLERGECAVCRTKVGSKQVHRVAATSSFTQSRQCDPSAGEALQEHVVGAWSIKVQAVVRRILAMIHALSGEKCLVFSQFPNALKLLGRALDVNGIKYAQLSGNHKAGRDAFKSFNETEEVRVFFLSHRTGATGLTLVRANHVFLLEPAMDPSIEQQAIARVHRIGQQRSVHIHRLVVQKSIEEEVIRTQQSKDTLLSPDSCDKVTTVQNIVKTEKMIWGDANIIMNAILHTDACNGIA